MGHTRRKLRPHNRARYWIAALCAFLLIFIPMIATLASWQDSIDFEVNASTGQWTDKQRAEVRGSNPGAVVSAGENTIVSDIQWNIPSPLTSNATICLSAKVNGTEEEALPWSIGIHESGAPLNMTIGNIWAATGGNPEKVGRTDGYLWITSIYRYDNQGQPVRTLTKENTINVGWCWNYSSTPVPEYIAADGSPTYSVEFSEFNSEGNSICQTATISSNLGETENYPFWQGWTIEFDLSSAWDATAESWKRIEFSPNNGGGNVYSLEELGNHHYRLKASYAGAIKDGNPFSVSGCVKH